ncbi:integrase catalytic domain-containing protein [Trichonephila clavipes]|nr:integrase catalytic domain-containing protein [Trichonephila clavipes]
MARGCFNLRGWESNVPGCYIFRSSGVTSLLGLLWDLDQDTLKCKLNYSGEGEISKRNVLAMVHKIFDPLGILSPTTLLPKVLLQEAWKLKLKWDDPLPENIQKNFRKWRDEIVYLEKVNIPRYVEINENSELHLFVDACKSSYGACVYIRTVTPLESKLIDQSKVQGSAIKNYDYSPAGIDGLLYWCEAGSLSVRCFGCT